ncbi:MAG TPA: HEAT repeat domain-containing protein [Acidobacteriaceae bacterium]|nr:HEAT repeat domain-containing protein [Acidobacteriaceae bacterium]
MNGSEERGHSRSGARWILVAIVFCIASLCAPVMSVESANAQNTAAKASDTSSKAQDSGKNTPAQEPGAKGAPQKAQEASPQNPDATVAGESDMPAGTLPAHTTAAQRADSAWTMLTDAAADGKRPQTRIQALAALGMLRTPHSAKLIEAAMQDSDVDVRTAAALAAGQSGDRNLTTPLRNLLDDKEPQVVFTAAMTLWKMNDRSGEDILIAVADGDRTTHPTMVHGTAHKIDKDLHQPGKLAKLGAMQGASMLLGPFGFGIAAFNFIHQSGGDLARASAIEAIAQEHTQPIHQELLSALEDKDPTVRAAAAKGLVDYRDYATSMAVYGLFVDPKNPVRLTAAAAYLRTTGVPGPNAGAAAKAAARARMSSTKH